MRLCFGSGDLGRLSVTCLRTSCPPELFPASSLASLLTRLGGNFTTPPRVVFCPPRTSPSTSRCLTTGPAPSGVSQVDAVEPVEVAGDSGARSGGAEPGRAESGGAKPGGAEPGGAEPGSAEPGGEEPGGAGSTRVASRTASSRRELLSPQELREWFARRWSCAAGAGGTPGAAGTGGAATAAGVGPAGASGAASAGAASGVGAGVCPAGGTAGAAGGTGAAGAAGVGAAGASGALGAGAAEGVSVGGSPDAGSSAGAGVGAVGAGGAIPTGSGDPARPRPYFVPLLEQVLGLPPSSGPAPSLECPQPVQSQSLLQPVSPLPAPSPYTGPTGGLAERREPASRPALPIRAARTSGRAPRQRPPAVPRTHQMALRPSTASQRVPLPSPPASSLPILADPESDFLRAASPTVARLLSTVVTDPSFESAAASALVAELVDFAACCRLDYAAGLVAESASVCPPSVGVGTTAPPVLYVDNKAMLALCREHRLEHRTKHIALRYFLARELQQRGQSRLAYVASEANTADVFTKALPPGDHQRFCTMLGLVPTWPHLLTS
ncbi:unnamed protein product [Closterium sp. NIES-54]